MKLKNMMRKVITYTEEQLTWIKQHCTLPRREAHKKFMAVFNRDDVTAANYAALCKRNGWLTGRSGQFSPGDTPHNLGKKMAYHPNSAKTQFKKGQSPHNLKALGHERLHEDGYIYINIEDKNPHTGHTQRYVLKHKYLWEQKNGPLPKGSCLKCLDGDRQNTDPENWEIISRAALPFLNGHRGHHYEDAPPEVRPAILTLAKLKAAAASKRKKGS